MIPFSFFNIYSRTGFCKCFLEINFNFTRNYKTFILLTILAIEIQCDGPSKPLNVEKDYGDIYSQADPNAYDLVIYGATPAGIMAGIQARRLGLSVVIIEPGTIVGGMSSNGLGFMDLLSSANPGGMTKEFFVRVKKYYERPEAWKYQNGDTFVGGSWKGLETMRFVEPHVAQMIFSQWILDENIKIVFRQRLSLNRQAGMEGVIKLENVIRRIRLESGMVIPGKVFIDASYEGDLMAMSNVSYTVGRESNSTYGETLNGIQRNLKDPPQFQFQVNIDPYRIAGNSASGLLPGILPDLTAPDGVGDLSTQAYTYRLCLTNVLDNRIPVGKPSDYREELYEILFRIYEKAPNSTIAFSCEPVPNLKTDTNNTFCFSTDFVGANSQYVDGDYQTRDAVLSAHRSYQQGLIWTLANHPRVPPTIRSQASQWGLCKDEFLELNGWPEKLYIRECRRMIGNDICTQGMVEGRIPVKNPIARIVYNYDCHTVNRYIDAGGFVRNEGGFYISHPIFSVPYQAILPRVEQVGNLLVPVCLSASHVAYSAIRMEPQFMVLGEVSGIAAALALKHRVVLQKVPYIEVQEELMTQGIPVN